MLQSLNDLVEHLLRASKYQLFTIGEASISLGSILMALVLLLFATRLSKVITNLINRRLIVPFVPEKSAQSTYQTLLFYFILGAMVTLALTVAGIPLTVFTVVGGALAIGVGFGSQNIVNNFISGIILLFERPIKVGDLVEIDNIIGSVQSIGTRSTKIRNGDGKIFVIPNSFFLEKSVLNWSYRSSVVRTTITFGVTYESDVLMVERLCMDLLKSIPEVKQAPMPLVLFENFGESALEFQLYFWCDLTGVVTLGEIRSKIRFKIHELLKEHGITMAFPQRDMNLKLSKALEVKVLS